VCARPLLCALPLLCGVLLAAGGCRDASLVHVVEEVDAAERLDFGSVWVGAQAEHAVEVRNPGRATRTLRVTATPPFSVDGEALVLAPGEARALPVRFTPGMPGAHAGRLTLQGAQVARAVSLTGEGRAPPACAPSDACRSVRFDPASGACVETHAGDGTPCEDACLGAGARCEAGRCVGAARACDDGNACTSDGCSSAEGGCVHTPLACAAPAEACRAAFCDPARGCGVTDAPDGTACGGPVRCGAREVGACLAGGCRQVEAPPGAGCPPAPCEEGADGAPGVLQRAWSHPLPRGVQPGALFADGRGTLFYLEYSGPWPGRATLVSRTPQGRERFRVALPARPQSWVLRMVGEVLLLQSGDAVEARAPDTGAALWAVSLRELGARLEGRAMPDDTLGAHWARVGPGVLGARLSVYPSAPLASRVWLLHLSARDGGLLVARAGPDHSWADWASGVVVDRGGHLYSALNVGHGRRLERYGPDLGPAYSAPLPEGTSVGGLSVGDGVVVRWGSDPAPQGPVMARHTLDAPTGAPLWTEPARSTPALLQDGRAASLVQGEDGAPLRLEVHEARSGAPLWTRDFPGHGDNGGPFWASESGALLVGLHTVRCPPAPGGGETCAAAVLLRAFDGRDGAPLWACTTVGNPGSRNAGVLGPGQWAVWEAASGGAYALVSYALPGWDLSSTGWPQAGGGPEGQWRERGP
jgi:hypothetical protein